jgi:hypothetical protein
MWSTWLTPRAMSSMCSDPTIEVHARLALPPTREGKCS